MYTIHKDIARIGSVGKPHARKTPIPTSRQSATSPGLQVQTIDLRCSFHIQVGLQPVQIRLVTRIASRQSLNNKRERLFKGRPALYCPCITASSTWPIPLPQEDSTSQPLHCLYCFCPRLLEGLVQHTQVHSLPSTRSLRATIGVCTCTRHQTMRDQEVFRNHLIPLNDPS